MIVDSFNALLRALVSGFAALFAAYDPLVGLSVASVVIGLGMLWVVGRTSDQQAISQAKKHMQARLLEMRLYQDEPVLLLRAQGHLLVENFRYVRHMLRPALFLALPMVVLYGHFDAVYGRRPLRVGETALLAANTALGGDDISLSGSEAILVDSDSVRSAAAGQVVWRIRAEAEGPASLALQTPEGEILKTVLTTGELAYVSQTRTASWWQRLLLSPGESGYDLGSVASVEIGYPARKIGVAGWETHWVVWFLLISLVSAFLLKGWFGVVL